MACARRWALNDGQALVEGRLIDLQVENEEDLASFVPRAQLQVPAPHPPSSYAPASLHSALP